jgi:hypothetical protein
MERRQQECSRNLLNLCVTGLLLLLLLLLAALWCCLSAPLLLFAATLLFSPIQQSTTPIHLVLHSFNPGFYSSPFCFFFFLLICQFIMQSEVVSEEHFNIPARSTAGGRLTVSERIKMLNSTKTPENTHTANNNKAVSINNNNTNKPAVKSSGPRIVSKSISSFHATLPSKFNVKDIEALNASNDNEPRNTNTSNNSTPSNAPIRVQKSVDFSSSLVTPISSHAAPLPPRPTRPSNAKILMQLANQSQSNQSSAAPSLPLTTRPQSSTLLTGAVNRNSVAAFNLNPNHSIQSPSAVINSPTDSDISLLSPTTGSDDDEESIRRREKEAEEKHRKEEEEKERELEAQLTAEQQKEREEMRAKINAEIISTEQSYISALEAIHVNLLGPVKALQNEWEIPAQTVIDLCSNIEVIVNFHRMLIMELTGAKISVPEVFLKYSDYLKMYTQYLSNYPNMMKAVGSLRSHAKFQHLFKELKNSQKLSLDLTSYLIQPVQRVPRYVLLLKELRRHTGPSHSHYSSLISALNKIQVIASFINEGKRQAENLSKVSEIQSRISGDMRDLVSPTRKLVKEGILQTMASKGLFGTVKMKPYSFYLFNDLLLWVNEQHKFKGSLDLGGAKCDDSKRTELTLEISNSKGSILLIMKDEAEFQSWFSEITSQISKLLRSREKILQRQNKAKNKTMALTDRENMHTLLTQGLAAIQHNAATASDNLSVDESVNSSRKSAGSFGNPVETHENLERSESSDSVNPCSAPSSAAATAGDEGNNSAAADPHKKFQVRQVISRISRSTLTGNKTLQPQ